MYETEMFPSDPSWLNDHQVYGRVVMPGAVYGAMAATVQLVEGRDAPVVEELQLHNPLVYPAFSPDGEREEPGRRLQVVIGGSKDGDARTFEVFSKGEDGEDWLLHAEGRLSADAAQPAVAERVDLDTLKANLSAQDLSAYYRAKTTSGIEFGPSFRTLEALWGEGGEAVGEVALQGAGETGDLDIHPLLIDGCFQVFSATRSLFRNRRRRHLSAIRMGEAMAERPPARWTGLSRTAEGDRSSAGCEWGDRIETPETLTGDLLLYTPEGDAIGGLTGLTVKRATRAALLSASEGLQEMLYEVVWRERPLAGTLKSAEALAGPIAAGEGIRPFADYLSDEGVSVDDRAMLLSDLERLSRSYSLAALERLGWQRRRGEAVEPDTLRDLLQIEPQHTKLVGRMLRLLWDAGPPRQGQ